MGDKLQIVKNAIKEYPDFPKKGIQFQDIFGVLYDPVANRALNDLALEHVQKYSDKIDKIAGLNSRGFLFGNAMALAVEKPFVPIRKKGKLPGECKSVGYSLEYGQDCLEIQVEKSAYFFFYFLMMTSGWQRGEGRQSTHSGRSTGYRRDHGCGLQPRDGVRGAVGSLLGCH